MRVLTVAAGSGSTSPLASGGKAGIMLHQSDTLTSSPWDLTDRVNKVVVYRHIQYSQAGENRQDFFSCWHLFLQIT